MFIITTLYLIYFCNCVLIFQFVSHHVLQHNTHIQEKHQTANQQHRLVWLLLGYNCTVVLLNGSLQADGLLNRYFYQIQFGNLVLLFVSSLHFCYVVQYYSCSITVKTKLMNRLLGESDIGISATVKSTVLLQYYSVSVLNYLAGWCCLLYHLCFLKVCIYFLVFIIIILLNCIFCLYCSSKRMDTQYSFKCCQFSS